MEVIEKVTHPNNKFDCANYIGKNCQRVVEERDQGQEDYTADKKDYTLSVIVSCALYLCWVQGFAIIMIIGIYVTAF